MDRTLILFGWRENQSFVKLILLEYDCAFFSAPVTSDFRRFLHRRCDREGNNPLSVEKASETLVS